MTARSAIGAKQVAKANNPSKGVANRTGKRGRRPQLVDLAQYGSVDHKCRTCGRKVARYVNTENDGWRHIRYAHLTSPVKPHRPVLVPLLGYLR